MHKLIGAGGLRVSAWSVVIARAANSIGRVKVLKLRLSTITSIGIIQQSGSFLLMLRNSTLCTLKLSAGQTPFPPSFILGWPPVYFMTVYNTNRLVLKSDLKPCLTEPPSRWTANAWSLSNVAIQPDKKLIYTIPTGLVDSHRSVTCAPEGPLPSGGLVPEEHTWFYPSDGSEVSIRSRQSWPTGKPVAALLLEVFLMHLTFTVLMGSSIYISILQHATYPTRG